MQRTRNGRGRASVARAGEKTGESTTTRGGPPRTLPTSAPRLEAVIRVLVSAAAFRRSAPPSVALAAAELAAAAHTPAALAGGSALVHVLIATIEVVEGEVVGARDDAELVRLPVVVVDDQAVCIALAAIEDGECHIDRLSDRKVAHGIHLLVEQQHTAPLLLLGADARRQAQYTHREQARQHRKQDWHWAGRSER